MSQLEISMLRAQIDEIQARRTDYAVGVEPDGIKELREELDVAALSCAERRKYLLEIFIEYPYLQVVKAKVKQCHEDGLFDRRFSCAEPVCMFVAGESNAGKSALISAYSKQFPREYDGERTRIPVLTVVLPSKATPKNVAIKILQALGDPNAERGSTAVVSSRVANYIRDCEVELLVLDELHHFINHETEKVLLDASEWLKTLIIDTKVPVVALGKPNARSVLDYNEQLKRRFARRHELTPFPWDYSDPQTITEFRKFLKALDYRLPLAQRSNLAATDMATRIHYATDGGVGYIWTLIREAALLAFRGAAEQIQLQHLSEAFVEHIRSTKPQKQDPFVIAAFDPELLVKWKAQELPPAVKEQPIKKPKKPRASEILKR